MLRSLRLAFRVLFKTPFVTAIAVLSLALGIGANSAIFSMFDQLLLQRVPVPSPGELVKLSAPGPKPGSTSCSQAGGCEVVFSYPMYRDLEQKQDVLSGLAAHRSFGANLLVRNEPMTGQGLYVSGSYFPTLRLQASLGRLLTPADDDAIGAHSVAVLGYAFWQSRFGADSSVVNQTLVVNGQTMTIVGVAPKDFYGITLGDVAQVYVPISMRGVLEQGFRGFERRSSYWVYVFGRRKPGTTMDQVSDRLNAIYRPIINDVEAPLQSGMSEQTMGRFREKQIVVEAGEHGQTTIQEEAATPLWLLFGVTGIVLLIACANVANLLLARGAGRAMEMGVRLSLGATRWQLIRQLLVESVVLAALGGVASLLIAKATLGSISAMLPAEAVTTLRFEVQPAVVVFAGALSLITGVVFGLFPALHSTRPDLVATIRANAGQIAGGGRIAARFRSTLVTLQIALSMALLISAGLFLKSLLNVSKVELGLKIDHVVTFAVSPIRSGYDYARAAVLFARLEEDLAGMPGVNGVTASMVPLLSGSSWGTTVDVQGFERTPDTDAESRFTEVGASYFEVLGLQLLAGRDFTTADRAGAGQVAVVNESFARKFNLGNDVVGKFMSTSGRDSMNIQIVGLVKNAGYSDVKDSVPAVFYTPWRQDNNVGSMYFFVRTSSDPSTLLKAIPPVVANIDRQIPVEELKTMPQQIKENIFLDRMISSMTTVFAALATLLAAIGLYGVLAYTVAQRTREIGVRMALGADAGRVRLLVLKQVAWLTGIGGVLGVAAALGLGRAARSILFGLEGHDPVVFALSIVALTLVAVAAGFVPAQRAAKVSPMGALRYE
jgi:predicted permease